jgi:subtilisin-like proprotein convertase family protein
MTRLTRLRQVGAVSLTLLSTLWAFGLQGAVVFSFDTFDGAADLLMPDGNASGVSDNRTISSAITSIGSIKVTLDLSAEFNGDLYAYLRHETGFAVLLNRVGRSGSLSAGYDDSGMQITLSDAAPAGDVHVYQSSVAFTTGNPLTGIWQPDARNVDPSTVTDDPGSRSAYLNSFEGLNPNGSWTLFVADLQSGGNSSLAGWSLEIESSIPEPGAGQGVVGLGLIGYALWRVRRRKHEE